MYSVVPAVPGWFLMPNFARGVSQKEQIETLGGSLISSQHRALRGGCSVSSCSFKLQFRGLLNNGEKVGVLSPFFWPLGTWKIAVG